MAASYLSKMTYFSTLSPSERVAHIDANGTVMNKIANELSSIEWQHVGDTMVRIFANRTARLSDEDLEQATADLTHIEQFINAVKDVRFGDNTWHVRAFFLASNGLEQGWDLAETLNIAERVAYMTTKMEDWATD
jgi:adenosine deaminase